MYTPFYAIKKWGSRVYTLHGYGFVMYLTDSSFEPRREKTGLLPMRKQRRRSASQ